MHRIVYKRRVHEDLYTMFVEAPEVAREQRPGQFVIVQVDDQYGERIPLTIADADPARGTITLVFQAVGRSTHKLADLAEGQRIPVVVGPLGQPAHIGRFGTVVGVGGGVGIAPLFPILRAMRNAGNRVIAILGARTGALILLEEEMRAVSDEILLCTNDGSVGRRGLVTEPLEEVCRRDPRPDRVVAIGPPIMMKFCAETTKPYGIPTFVSLNTIMVDGTGMCGGCRVTVGGVTRFACVDGPEFDAHQVDFDTMMNRLRAYQAQERKAHEAYHHACQIESATRR